MDDVPLFSVVVTTYDRPRLLREAVGSVLGQTVRDLECLIVHDGGPGAVDLPPDPRARVLRLSDNRGVGAARNAGIEAARGRYVSFLDDDDVYHPRRLEMALPLFDRSPVAVCGVAFLGSDVDRHSDARLLEGDLSDTILDQLTPNVGAVTIERQLTPRFDESFIAVEDVEWWLRLARTLEFAATPEIGLYFRNHAGPRHRNGLEVRIRYRVEMMHKHADYFEAHPRAAAFQLKRLGLTAQRLGDPSTARQAFWASLRRYPSASTARHLVRRRPPARIKDGV